MTLKQSPAVHIQALVLADGIRRATSAAKKIKQSLEVSSEFISGQIFNTISVVNSAIDKLHDASKQFCADEITLGLAVSAEGNIGLVSAGVEATIEIKFKRVDKVSGS